MKMAMHEGRHHIMPVCLRFDVETLFFQVFLLKLLFGFLQQNEEMERMLLGISILSYPSSLLTPARVSSPLPSEN